LIYLIIEGMSLPLSRRWPFGHNIEIRTDEAGKVTHYIPPAREKEVPHGILAFTLIR
jgi:hypothetical protein